MNREHRILDPSGYTDAQVDADGNVNIKVPNKRIARLISLGVHVEVAQRHRAERRKAAKLSRRRNRRKH